MALTRREVIRTMRFGPRDAARVAELMYRAKSREYRDTLLALSNRYGHPRSRVVLGAEIRGALRAEARDHARKVLATTNAAIEAEAKRRNDLPASLLSLHLRGFVRERARRRSTLIATNETATARLDAQVAFYRENGIEPAFDFTGPRAKCRLCQRLKAGADGRGAPWPIDVVIRIGQPHIACTHSWRARAYSAAKLSAGGLRPGQISAGRGGIAGIVGGDPLVNRHGSTDEALAYLDQVIA